MKVKYADLKNKRVFITGGGSGIGASIVEHFCEQGKLKGKMPKAWVIGLLSGLGMWTFFLFIGIIAVMMGEAFEKSGIISQIAFIIAVLLVILEFFFRYKNQF